MDKLEFIISTRDLCKIANVSNQTLTDWKKAGCPYVGTNKWNLADVYAWDRARFAKQTPSEEDSDMKSRKLKADTEYREERARRERILREALEELYFLRSDVEKAWADRVLETKSAFLLLEKTLPMELAGKDENEMESIIASRVREVLADHARGGKYTPDTGETSTGNNSLAPAGKTTRKPVGRPKSNSRSKNKRDARKVEN